jgi:hypothetical protein
LDWSTYELYQTERLDDLSQYIGRLVVDWGVGARQWVQLASKQNKQVIELRRHFIEPPFPGFIYFVEQLSNLEKIPVSWKSALESVKGVYLLTCPSTSEQYVGSATGVGGLLGRWLNYLYDGHGGNVALKSRYPSDYRVSILQLAGSADTTNDILAMEILWKQKLQSREMGLNRN